jgi:hypothetical protein
MWWTDESKAVNLTLGDLLLICLRHERMPKKKGPSGMEGEGTEVSRSHSILDASLGEGQNMKCFKSGRRECMKEAAKPKKTELLFEDRLETKSR